MKLRFCLLLGFVLVLSNILSASGSAIDEPCKDVAIVFARGSSQNPNHKFVDSVEDNRFYEEEKQSYTFFKEISKRLKNVSIDKITLHDFEGRYNQYGYQAVDVVTGFKQRPNHRKDVPNRYYESVADGAEELTWFLEDRMTSCPFQQIILGGYSQGAQVVGDALYKIKPNFRPRIAYTALFGDPKFNPRTSNIPIKTGPWVRGNVWGAQSGILLPRNNYLPDEVANATSWCDFSDPVCANYGPGQLSGANLLIDSFIDNTHTNIYQNKWIPQSANEIANVLQNRLSFFKGKTQTITYINKNDKLYQLDLAIVFDTTGSMNAFIATTKARLDSFTNALFNSYWDTRVGIVAFNDDTTQGKTYFSKKITDFTYSKTNVSNGIKTLTAMWGGDEPEAMYSGLMTAMNSLQWRLGAQKKILVITDAEAKNPDPGLEKWTKQQVEKRALELDPVSISLVSFPLNYPRYATATQIKTMDDSYKTSVLDLISSTNGVITYGQRDYKTEYAMTTADQMAMQPVASIAGLASGYVGNSIQFNAGDSYDPNSSIKEYVWDFNNDGVWDYTSANPSTEYTYTSTFNSYVVMETRSEDGGSAKAIHNISIKEPDAQILESQKPPEQPIVNEVIARVNNEYTVSWQNIYDSNNKVVIADLNDNVLGYVVDSNNYLLTDLDDNLFNLKLTVVNNNGQSEPTYITIPPKTYPPGKPIVDAWRDNTDIVINWLNEYTQETSIKLTDGINNILSGIIDNKTLIINNAPVSNLIWYLSACNIAGCSESAKLEIPELLVISNPPPIESGGDLPNILEPPKNEPTDPTDSPDDVNPLPAQNIAQAASNITTNNNVILSNEIINQTQLSSQPISQIAKEITKVAGISSTPSNKTLITNNISINKNNNKIYAIIGGLTITILSGIIILIRRFSFW